MTLDISQLSIAERIQLVEDIWDSIAARPDELPATEAQHDEDALAALLSARALPAVPGAPQRGLRAAKAFFTDRGDE